VEGSWWPTGWRSCRDLVTPWVLDDSHWQLLRRILRDFGSALDEPTFLDDCLDTLVEALRADRGLVVRFWPDGGIYPVNARGPGRALDAMERAEVSRTIIEHARKADDAILWDDSPSPSESVRHLGILRALAAPLRARENRELLGVIYLDFRHLRHQPDEGERELLGAVAELLGPVLAQHDDVLRMRSALHEAEASREVPTPPLNELLALPGLLDARREIAAFLRSEDSLLVEGESGTGKTLLAHAMAAAAERRPIVRATLGTSDDMNTITSELFGHERGSFSGATERRVGLVEHADGGTLILDEVLNLSLRAQQLLLDFAQFGTFRPLGYKHPEPKRANVRIIAATNGDLPLAVEAGRFREDLYFRLAATAIVIPPLRDRRGDIPILAERFLRRIGGPQWTIGPALRELLVAPSVTLPGNVRQLEAAIRRAFHRASIRGGQQLSIEDLRPLELGVPTRTSTRPPSSHDNIVARTAERRQSKPPGVRGERPTADALATLLRDHDGNVTRLAEALGIGRNTLYRWLKEANVELNAVRADPT
jgi:DNA-binding NtrC family response regulator